MKGTQLAKCFVLMLSGLAWDAMAAPLLEYIPVNQASLSADQLNTIKKSDMGTQVVRIAATSVALDTPTLTLNLPDQRTLEVHRKSSRKTRDGLYWYGEVKSNGTTESIQVHLVIDGSMVSGSFIQNQKLYSLRPIKAGVSILVPVSKQLPDHTPDEMEDHTSSSGDSSQGQATMDGAKARIRVLVAYTPAVAQAHADVRGLIDLAVQETNTSYDNSGVNATLELAAVQPVNYVESGSQVIDVDRLANMNDNQLDDLGYIRENTEADVVLLLTKDGSACGRAKAIGAEKNSAFAVVFWECATGYYSFGHEIGHLYGARHNVGHDNTNTPFAFGHGYYPDNQTFRTVMSYDCPNGCTRVPYWSNPKVNYNGLPTGVENAADNAKVLNTTGVKLSGFMDETCRTLRQQLLDKGAISKPEFDAYSESGFAPIFSTPGNPNSPISFWAACSVAKTL